MLQDDARRTRPDHPCRHDELLLTEREELAAHEARGTRPAKQTDDRNDGKQARPDDRYEHDHHEQERNAQDDVHQSHHNVIQPAAEIACQRAEQRADHHIQEHRENAHRQRGACTINDATQNVASDQIRAERVRCAWRLTDRPQIDRLRAQSQQWEQCCDDHRDNDDDQSRDRESVSRESVEGLCRCRSLPRRHDG